MPVQDRVNILKDKHAKLENAIATENGRPLPDESILHDLKRQKLRIKDEISRISSG